MKKACKKCKVFVDGPTCPICKGTEFVTNWKGRVAILNAEKSEVAKKADFPVDGEYAIKVK